MNLDVKDKVREKRKEREERSAIGEINEIKNHFQNIGEFYDAPIKDWL